MQVTKNWSASTYPAKMGPWGIDFCTVVPNVDCFMTASKLDSEFGMVKFKHVDLAVLCFFSLRGGTLLHGNVGYKLWDSCWDCYFSSSEASCSGFDISWKHIMNHTSTPEVAYTRNAGYCTKNIVLSGLTPRKCPFRICTVNVNQYLPFLSFAIGYQEINTW